MLLGPKKRTLLVMDNNGAFNTKFSPRMRQRLEAPLRQVERISATLYRRLVGLSAEDIRAELALDLVGQTLLSDVQVAAVLERRDQVVEQVDALKRVHGHDAVLCFP